MATFNENLKLEARRGVQSAVENSTGIFGQAIRDKRIREEKQRNIQSQVQRIQQTTGKMKSVSAAFSSIETSFIQMSANLRLIAKAMDAQVTLQGETDKLQQEENKLRKQTFDISKEKTPAQQSQSRQVEQSINKEQKQDESIFSKISDLIDGFEKRGKIGRGKTGGRIGGKLSKFGKVAGRVAGKILGPLALAEGIYESKKFLDETKYGERMAQGEGKIAEKAFREKGTDFSKLPLTAEQAKDILDSNNKNDIRDFGGRERLEKIANLAKPVAVPPVQVTLPPTGAGGGRGMVNPALVTPAAEPTNVLQTQYGAVTSGTGAAITIGTPAAPKPVTEKPAHPVEKPQPAGTGLKPGGGIGLKLPTPSPGDGWVMDMIKRHEGVRTKPYKDSLGLWTVGVGHLIGDGKSLPPEWDRELTKQEVDNLFMTDYESHKQAATKIPGYEKVDEKGKGALIDLTFNMGNTWYKKWPNFVKNLSTGNTEGAAASLEDSKWYQQVKGRAATIVGLIRNSSTQVTQAPTQGHEVSSQSTSVASARKEAAQQQPQPVTIVAVNNTQVIKKPPQAVAMRESSTLVAS